MSTNYGNPNEYLANTRFRRMREQHAAQESLPAAQEQATTPPPAMQQQQGASGALQPNIIAFPQRPAVPGFLRTLFVVVGILAATAILAFVLSQVDEWDEDDVYRSRNRSAAARRAHTPVRGTGRGRVRGGATSHASRDVWDDDEDDDEDDEDDRPARRRGSAGVSGGTPAAQGSPVTINLPGLPVGGTHNSGASTSPQGGPS